MTFAFSASLNFFLPCLLYENTNSRSSGLLELLDSQGLMCYLYQIKKGRYKLFIKCGKLSWYLLLLRSCLDRKRLLFFGVSDTYRIKLCTGVLSDEHRKMFETEQSSQRGWTFYLRSSAYFLLMTILSTVLCKGIKDVLKNVPPLIPNYIVRFLLLAEKKTTTLK